MLIPKVQLYTVQMLLDISAYTKLETKRTKRFTENSSIENIDSLLIAKKLITVFHSSLLLQKQQYKKDIKKPNSATIHI